MITPKQRAYLKRQAHTLTPSLVIGKGGLSEELIKQMDEQLRKRELVKGTCLNTSPISADEAARLVLDA